MSGVILIVDDSRDLREVLGEILLSEGYAVAYAASGREALDYVQSRPLPSLILLDVGMPDMDGTTFLQHRAADTALSSIPVVLLSGAGDLSTRAADAGVDCLNKPVGLEELIDVVKRHCGDP